MTHQVDTSLSGSMIDINQIISQKEEIFRYKKYYL